MFILSLHCRQKFRQPLLNSVKEYPTVYNSNVYPTGLLIFYFIRILSLELVTNFFLGNSFLLLFKPSFTG